MKIFGSAAGGILILILLGCAVLRRKTAKDQAILSPDGQSDDLSPVTGPSWEAGVIHRLQRNHLASNLNRSFVRTLTATLDHNLSISQEELNLEESFHNDNDSGSTLKGVFQVNKS